MEFSGKHGGLHKPAARGSGKLARACWNWFVLDTDLRRPPVVARRGRSAGHAWRAGTIRGARGWPSWPQALDGITEMNKLSGRVTDSTSRLAESWAGSVPDWKSASVILVSAHRQGVRSLPPRGGLAAGTLRRITQYIESELAGPLQLHDLALIAGLSDCHFARAFKTSTGMPPHRYVMKRRIERALEMIRKTDRPLSRIALESGFCDQSHFSRLIARATGYSPRDLRRGSVEPAGGIAPTGVVA